MSSPETERDAEETPEQQYNQILSRIRRLKATLAAKFPPGTRVTTPESENTHVVGKLEHVDEAHVMVMFEMEGARGSAILWEPGMYEVSRHEDNEE